MTRCLDTATECGETKSHKSYHDLIGSRHSIESGDHYSLTTGSSINSSMIQRIYQQDQRHAHSSVPTRTVEQVHVRQCRICVIL